MTILLMTLTVAIFVTPATSSLERQVPAGGHLHVTDYERPPESLEQMFGRARAVARVVVTNVLVRAGPEAAQGKGSVETMCRVKAFLTVSVATLWVRSAGTDNSILVVLSF
jgi:hypothetical protein